MSVTPLVIKLTREQTLERIARMEQYLNRETGESDPQTYVALSAETILDRQREHWKKLHTTRMTPPQFSEWVDSIPGCSTCQKDFKNIIEKVPPRYDDWEKWSWEVHNLVNEKIGKPVFSWQEACELWRWNHEPNGLNNAEDNGDSG